MNDRSGMKIDEIKMTPALAIKLLQANVMNRLLSPRRVNSLAHAMASGNWRNDGNPIKMGSDGRLIDGQHRLAAVIQSGASVTMLLATEVDPLVRMTVDTGRSRSFRDYLRMEDVRQASDVAAAVRLVFTYRDGTLQGSEWQAQSIGIEDLWKLYQSERDEFTAAVSAAGMLRKQSELHMPRSALGACAFLFAEVAEDWLQEFFAELRHNATPSNGPMILLRLTASDSWKRRMVSQKMAMAFMIKAWNIYVRGDDKTQVLAWKNSGTGREVFPAIEKPES